MKVSLQSLLLLTTQFYLWKSYFRLLFTHFCSSEFITCSYFFLCTSVFLFYFLFLLWCPCSVPILIKCTKHVCGTEGKIIVYFSCEWKKQVFSATFVESLLMKQAWCYVPLPPYLVMFELLFGLGENAPSSKTLSQLAMSTALNKIGLESKLKSWTPPLILLNY